MVAPRGHTAEPRARHGAPRRRPRGAWRARGRRAPRSRRRRSWRPPPCTNPEHERARVRARATWPSRPPRGTPRRDPLAGRVPDETAAGRRHEARLRLRERVRERETQHADARVVRFRRRETRELVMGKRRAPRRAPRRGRRGDRRPATPASARDAERVALRLHRPGSLESSCRHGVLYGEGEFAMGSAGRHARGVGRAERPRVWRGDNVLRLCHARKLAEATRVAARLCSGGHAERRRGTFVRAFESGPSSQGRRG